jgi:hypothetical protein
MISDPRWVADDRKGQRVLAQVHLQEHRRREGDDQHVAVQSPDVFVAVPHLDEVYLTGQSRQVPQEDQNEDLVREGRQRDGAAVGAEKGEIVHDIADTHGRFSGAGRPIWTGEVGFR